ncbi:MAG: hypothetical protein NT118_13530, partial [Lentisphaerae bacterium]|nr:hypothetical protein [Lentisphaerota bacterium]
MPGEKVRLEISFDYFRKFQILLYSVTAFFLLLSAIFNYLYIVTMKSQAIALHNHAEFKEILSAEAYLILIG